MSLSRKGPQFLLACVCGVGTCVCIHAPDVCVYPWCVCECVCVYMLLFSENFVDTVTDLMLDIVILSHESLT